MEEEGGGRGEKEERHFLVFLAPSPLQAPHRSPCQASPAGMSARRKWGGRRGASRRGGVAPVRMSVSWVSRFPEGGLGEGGGGFESGAKGG